MGVVNTFVESLNLGGMTHMVSKAYVLPYAVVPIENTLQYVFILFIHQSYM